MAIAPLLAALVAAQPAPADFVAVPRCPSVSAPIDRPCSLPVSFNPVTAQRLIGTRTSIWWLRGDTLTMIARPTAAPWVALCCSIQTGLAPIAGTDLAGITVRVPHLADALLDIKAAPGPSPVAVLRGRNAPTAPPLSEPLRGTLQAHVFMSAALGEPRTVWFYQPPGIAATERLPVVYMADGWARSFASVAEALIVTKQIRPLILVGLEAARSTHPNCVSADCDRRGREYALGGSNPLFPAHQRFLVEEVMPYAAMHYQAAVDRRERAVAGFSQGGVWAAQLAQLRPDLFGNAIAFSGTGEATLAPEALSDTRLFTGAGRFEPDRLMAMHHLAETARAAHADVREDTLWAGHTSLAFDIMLAHALEWLFPAQSIN